jgi:lactoylglutathione lyase
MRLRMELFVDDLDVSVAFYTGVLGFQVVRGGGDYVSLRRGLVVLGLGLAAKLPERGSGPGFTRQRLAAGRGAGVEIVLELDDLSQVTALHDRCRDRGAVAEALRLRPWGLHDFRIIDPDGYYLRITHGDAASEPAAQA